MIHPAFIWGLLALAVPLWLHLSRRRQHREIMIGSLRFLEEVLRERRRRSRFEELPLLLMRLLLVALAVMLFARPWLPASRRAAEAAAETLVLMDASGSITADMADEARSLAEDAVRGAAEGEKITLAQFSDSVETIADVSGYHPRAGAPTQLTAALDWALDRFSSLPPGRTGRVVLVGHLTAADLPEAPPRVWPPGVSVEVLPLHPPESDNAAVRSAALLTPYVTENMEIEVTVSLPQSVSREVTLEAEGLSLRAVVAPGSERVVFKFHPPRPEVRGVVHVGGGDAWPADDQRPFAVRWLEPRRVLLVDGKPGSTPYEGQAYFIEKALTASGAVHGKTPFQPSIVFGLTGRSGDADLTGVAAVALCGVQEMSAAEARILTTFHAGGGSILCVPDAGWTPAATSALAAAGLFPHAIRRTDAPDLRHLVQWDRAHPVLASFDGADGGDLAPLEWRDAFDLQPQEGWKPLATLDGGHVLIMEKNRTEETGRVIVLAHPLTREWTDLPRDPLFVPLVKSLFAFLANTETARPELPPLAPGLKEDRIPGIYAAPDGGTVIVAADAGESAVAPSTEAAFRTAFGIPDAAKIAAAPPPADDRALDSSTVPWRRELWPWLAAAIFLFLIVENMLATRRLPVNTSPA